MESELGWRAIGGFADERGLTHITSVCKIGMMKQWHPIFAQLLRPAVETFYEVRTTVQVGDVPREADIVLLRRRTPSPSYEGLWRHLTAWNVLEFKGPTVTPRSRDIELLMELGLGIDRRLNEEQGSQGKRRLPPEETSFWYLANRVGRRFLEIVKRKLGSLEALGPGLWRSQLLLRPVFVVSSVHLPVEEDSLPLHIVGLEPMASEREMAKLVLERPELQERYGGWLASLHPAVWKEIEAMARSTKRQLVFDIRPAIESLGLERVIEQVGLERVIEQVGLERVIEQIGEKEIVKRIGIDGFLANLSPAERRELKRRLE